MAHANLSPSSASRWMTCPGSVALDGCMPDSGSAYADEGTAAHALAELCLREQCDAFTRIGYYYSIGTREVYLGEPDNGGWVEITDDMAEHVQKYLDYVRSLGGDLMVEQRLPIDHLTGEQDARGTSDAVVLLGDELVIVDLKYGRGVKVDAEDNEQLTIYASSALRQFEVLGDFKQVRMVIHQPRLDHVSEAVLTVEQLREFEAKVKVCAAKAIQFIGRDPATVTADHLAPTESACRWCKAKATCPALANAVMDAVADDFVDLTDEAEVTGKVKAGTELVRQSDNERLAALLKAVPLVEMWVKAVESEAERRLHDGQDLPGWKLVEGKRGARAWRDEAEAEAVLKSMRLKQDEMYSFKLISPTQAEKLLKDNPRRWPKVQALITQKDGSPTVAPASDKRPAIKVNVAADFDNVAEEFA